MMGLVLSWDRVLGAILGFMLAWVVYSVLNQMLWLPAEREKGRDEVRAETLKRAVELVQERSRTDADIETLDDAGICRELGGVWDKGVCG